MKTILDSTDGSGMCITVDDRHPEAQGDQVMLMIEARNNILGMKMSPARARHLAQALTMAAEHTEAREAREAQA